MRGMENFWNFNKRGGGASIPDSRVDHSLTNLGFNELPHLTNQKLFPMEISISRTPALMNYILIPSGFVKSGYNR